jgi:hypothetical protein
MKLVAAKSFFNTKALGVKLDEKDPLFIHKDHIHQGARINVGSAEHYKDLGATDQENVGALIKRGLVVIDNKENADNGVIDDILKSAKVENAQYKKALEKLPSTEELIAAAVAKAITEANSGKK